MPDGSCDGRGRLLTPRVEYCCTFAAALVEKLPLARASFENCIGGEVGGALFD